MGAQQTDTAASTVNSDRPARDDSAERSVPVAARIPAAQPSGGGGKRTGGGPVLRRLAAGIVSLILVGLGVKLVSCGGTELGGSGSQPGKPAIVLPAGCPVGSIPCPHACVPEGFSCSPPDGSSAVNGLSQILFSAGTLSPAFNPNVGTYTLVLPGNSPITLQVTPTAIDARSTIRINNTPVPSGTASAPLSIGVGVTMIAITTELTGAAWRTYDIAVIRSTYFKAPNAGSGDRFGSAVALSGDTLAVAAPEEDSGARGIDGDPASNTAVDSGAVYVFVRTTTGWALQAYVKAFNADAGDRFGSAVALAGDTLVVGASGEASGGAGNPSDNSTARSGAAYVFVRIGSAWTQQAYLKAANPDVADGFGSSVSISGDTLAIGAPGEASSATGVNGNPVDNSAPGSGAVYVFVRGGATWTQQAYVKASNTEHSDGFGYRVSLDADTLACAAPGESSNATGIDGNQADNSAPSSGAVYLFTRSGGAWTQQAYVKASNTGAKDGFGRSVAVAGDSLVVGAPTEASSAVGIDGNALDDSLPLSGAAYVFVRASSLWTQQAYVKASNTGGGDLFGSSVALAGDWLAIGAPGEASYAQGAAGDQTNNSAAGAGAVYLFGRNGNRWTQQSYQKATNTAANDALGSAVALSTSLLVSGSPNEGSVGVGINGAQGPRLSPQSGAAYVSSVGP